MQGTRRLVVVTVALALSSTLPLTAGAVDSPRDAVGTDQPVRSVDTEGDKGVSSPERVADRPAIVDRSDVETPTDRPEERPNDRPDVRPTDRCLQAAVDRRCVDDLPDDRPIHRCLRLADNPRRCLIDHDTDLNIRHLIWRLIQAHEWKLLVRLFHALGWL
jgi:hypothetical protein